MASAIPITSLPLLSRGKVREIYAIDDKRILFVCSDRISAYDVILANAVPMKGVVLTLISSHFFSVLSSQVPGLKHHLLSLSPPLEVTPEERASIKGRSMVVRRLQVFKVEAIVRGYLSGSAWKEYEKLGTVHGIAMPSGLRQSEAFPNGPIYTPSTKADLGQHDENITPEQAAKIVGEKYASRIEELALSVYKAGAAYAAERGIIIADTKFEFGLDTETDEVVLIDEVLTPDSSRFWPADKYEVGRDQDSFDKQYLRNWLTENGLKGKDGVAMPPEVAEATGERYRDVFKRLTGKTLEEALAQLPE